MRRLYGTAGAGCWGCIRCCRTRWRLTGTVRGETFYVYDRYSDENPNFGEYGRVCLWQADMDRF